MQNPPSLRIRQQPFRSRRKRYCSLQLRLMQMAERRIDLSLRRPPFGCLYPQVGSAVSVSILIADIVAVRVVAVVVSAVGTVGRGTNRCGTNRRRAVSATRIIPSAIAVTPTRDAVPTHATGMNGSTSVNASHSGAAAVEASTASVPATTPTPARERVVRDKAGGN
jgi:hypothetical protein